MISLLWLRLALLAALVAPACAVAEPIAIEVDARADAYAFLVTIEGNSTTSVEPLGDAPITMTLEPDRALVAVWIERDTIVTRVPWFDEGGAVGIEHAPGPAAPTGEVRPDQESVRLAIPLDSSAVSIDAGGARPTVLAASWPDLAEYSLTVPARFERCAGDAEYELRPFLESGRASDADPKLTALEAVLILDADHVVVVGGTFAGLAARGAKTATTVALETGVRDLAELSRVGEAAHLIAVGGILAEDPGHIWDLSATSDRLVVTSSSSGPSARLERVLADRGHPFLLGGDGLWERAGDGEPIRRVEGPAGVDPRYMSQISFARDGPPHVLVGAGFAFRGDLNLGTWRDMSRESGFPPAPRLREYTFVSNPPSEWVGGYLLAFRVEDQAWGEGLPTLPPNGPDECTKVTASGFREVTSSIIGVGKLHTDAHVILEANNCPVLLLVRASDRCAVFLEGERPREYNDIDSRGITVVVGGGALEEIVERE
ncbi:MAG: hypothetical protein HY791_03245 [Deltaproteobacteria bacterium]|nr:hypothetical protein [Deltaproteobacteria bacterium]